MDYNIELYEIIKKARPNLKESSIKAYITNLNKLAKDAGIKKINNLIFLQHGGNIMRILDEKKLSTKKNYLSTIVVILKATDAKQNLIDFYSDLMIKYSEEQSEQINKNEKSDKQNENWISLPELQKIINDKGKEINRLRLWTKKKLTPSEFNEIQKYVVGMLYIGDDKNPPLRSNYADMEIICNNDFSKLDEKELKKNYLVKESPRKYYFHLGDYKTNGIYGNKKIAVGYKLLNVLKKWLEVNETGYLLVNNRKKAMNANSLSKYMNTVFQETGKKIGISLLRHIYISHHFPPEEQEKKEEIAELMTHSVSMQNQYSKK